jgi:hypothetical protein
VVLEALLVHLETIALFLGTAAGEAYVRGLPLTVIMIHDRSRRYMS